MAVLSRTQVPPGAGETDMSLEPNHMSDAAPTNTPAAAAEAAANAPTPTTPVPTPPPATAAPEVKSSDPINFDTLAPNVQKYLADLRKEAGDARGAKNAETERVNAILKAAGIKTDDPDPVAVAKSATEAATQATRELAVFKAAATSGADPSKLLDRASFLTSISGLDPSDGAAITAAINTAIAADPTLKAVLAASASGTELGGTGETGQLTEEQFARIKNDPEALVAAQNAGQLRNILGG